MTVTSGSVVEHFNEIGDIRPGHVSLLLCIFMVIVYLFSFMKKKSEEWTAGYNHRQRFAL